MPGASDSSASKKLYTSKIIKAGALLADTKTMLANWDETLSVAENLARFRRENIFGKASRSRIEDMLTIFRQRYLASASVTKALVTLVQGGFLNEALDRILYFHAAQADALLHDIVTEVLARFHTMGKVDVVPEDIRDAITKWIAEGRMTSVWSENTLVRAMGKTKVPAVLFYPGSWRGSLNYMDLKSDEEPLGSYRVKIYGRES